jgi:hypothetical protein
VTAFTQYSSVADTEDFWSDLDPDPDLNKFSANFLLDIFLMNICSKKYSHEPIKVKQIPEVFVFYAYQKSWNKVVY